MFKVGLYTPLALGMLRSALQMIRLGFVYLLFGIRNWRFSVTSYFALAVFINVTFWWEFISVVNVSSPL